MSWFWETTVQLIESLKSILLLAADIAADSFQFFASFITSPFGTTLLGTFVAAFAGAYGAHFTAEREERRRSLERELRITNAAIMLSFEICNSFIGLKKQYIRDLKNKFDAAQASFREFEEKVKAGEVPTNVVYELEMDLMALYPMVVPHEILVKHVFEQISAGARPCMLTSVLIRTVDSLNQSIEERNQLIRKYRESSDKWPGGMPSFYFGRPNRDGHTDMSYPQSMSAISSLTDDCIWFSRTLCKDLSKHGQDLKRRLGKHADKVHTPDFKKAVHEDLLPDSKNYHEWEW